MGPKWITMGQKVVKTVPNSSALDQNGESQWVKIARKQSKGARFPTSPFEALLEPWDPL